MVFWGPQSSNRGKEAMQPRSRRRLPALLLRNLFLSYHGRDVVVHHMVSKFMATYFDHSRDIYI